MPCAQVMLGLLVMIIAAQLHVRYQPFQSQLMNRFEYFSLSVSLLTFFLGVFTMEAANMTSTLSNPYHPDNPNITLISPILSPVP